MAASNVLMSMGAGAGTGAAVGGPWGALAGAFLAPFLYGLYLTLTSWDGVSKVKPFVGFENFAAAMQDTTYWQAMGRTVIYSVFAASPPEAGEESLSAVQMVWNYLAELIFNLLILVGAVKMSERVVKEMIGF